MIWKNFFWVMAMMSLLSPTVKSEALGPTQQDLQAKLKAEFNIDFNPAYGSANWSVSQAEYENFLSLVLHAARKAELGKRYAPFQFHLTSRTINPLDLIFNFCIDDGNSEVLLYAHCDSEDLAEAVIERMQEQPLEHSVEASNLRVRNEAVKSAIKEKIKWLADAGITVTSRDFGTNENPYYFSQEKFLQGIINVAGQVAAGNENRVNIVVADGDYDSLSFDYNFVGSNDEKELEKVIIQYYPDLPPGNY